MGTGVVSSRLESGMFRVIVAVLDPTAGQSDPTAAAPVLIRAAPPEAALDTIAQEGWIDLPLTDSLDKLGSE